jgi:2-phosphoglycolate phosphatase
VPEPPPIDAVAFDLDGTLIDSREDLASAVNRVRGELDLAPLPVARVVEMVGKGARNLVRRALSEENPRPPLEEIDREGFERAFERFLDLYFERCLERTRPYPGIEVLLDALRESAEPDGAGLPLAVVTNKPERHTGKVLRGLGLDRRLRFFLGGDSLPVKKPDPAPLTEAARRLGVAPERLLYVGDSEIDAETARRAGSPLVLVQWGFGSPEELAPFDCVLRAERPADIGDLLWRGRGGESEPGGIRSRRNSRSTPAGETPRG